MKMFRPGDVIVRRNIKGSVTTFYHAVDHDPACSGTDAKLGDVIIEHPYGAVLPEALVITSRLVCTEHGESCGGCMEAMEYNFVVWPGLGIGWVWGGYVNAPAEACRRWYRFDVDKDVVMI